MIAPAAAPAVEAEEGAAAAAAAGAAGEEKKAGSLFDWRIMRTKPVLALAAFHLAADFGEFTRSAHTTKHPALHAAIMDYTMHE